MTGKENKTIVKLPSAEKTLSPSDSSVSVSKPSDDEKGRGSDTDSNAHDATEKKDRGMFKKLIYSMKPKKGKTKIDGSALATGDVPQQGESRREVIGDGEEAAISATKDQEEAFQTKGDIVDKWNWVSGDRKKLYECIADMTRLNQVLSNLAELKPQPLFLQDYRSNDELDSWRGAVSTTRTAVQRLHRALRAMNRSSNPWDFAIKLESNYQLAWKEFGDDLPGSLKTDRFFAGAECSYFKMQRLCQNQDQSSEFFVSQARVVKVPQEKSFLGSIASQKAYDLERADFCKDIDAFDFAVWGFIVEDVDSTDVHRLYKDKSAEWHQHSSLKDALSLGSAVRGISTKERIQLAMLVTVSFAQVAMDHRSRSMINLSAFRYFVTQDEEINDQTNVVTELCPYLLCGLGQRPPKTSVTGGQKLQAVNAIIQLGILLEIGLCTERPAEKSKTAQVQEWGRKSCMHSGSRFQLPLEKSLAIAYNTGLTVLLVRIVARMIS